LWFAHRKGARAIVQVGDFGFWAEGWGTEHYLDSIEKDAREYGIPVYWLDGNHEDHSRKAEFNDPENRPMTTYLPRGFRWDWWGKRFMAVGGAMSVDKHYRKEGVSWWPEELLTDDEVDYACRDDGIPVDVVFSHDCPRGVNIPGVGPDTKSGVRGSWPADVLYEAEIHRNKVRKIWESVMPGLWVHGHYHIPYVSYLARGNDGPHTKFIGLGCDGDRMTATVAFVSFEKGKVVSEDPLLDVDRLLY